MSGVTYSIKCPSCSAEAVAHMRALGTTGTYREPRVKLGVGRITCGACGFNREVPAEEAGAYELWYATEFKGHRLWACNREHLAFLTAWFSGAIS